MKIFGGSKAQRRRLIVKAVENIICAGLFCGGGYALLRGMDALLGIVGAV